MHCWGSGKTENRESSYQALITILVTDIGRLGLVSVAVITLAVCIESQPA